MAKIFWGLIPIENAAALFFYHPHTKSARIVHQLKYFGMENVAQNMGRLIANEFNDYGFFSDIDIIVPMPTTFRRRLERGYNQCEAIAAGVREITALPIAHNAAVRTKFNGSQTRKSSMERRENVKNVFRLKDASIIKGKHVLIIDDIITTGATIMSLAEELMKGGVKKISVLTIGFTKS